ncbi:transposase [Novosphingobium resinovorum]|uniref:transposase n=1 Tax=Novosphingobium resinovorum TaxID=158500 RepID=UPI003B8A8741
MIESARGKRHWTPEARAQIIAQSLEPDANVSAVARRRRISAHALQAFAPHEWPLSIRDSPFSKCAHTTVFFHSGHMNEGAISGSGFGLGNVHDEGDRETGSWPEALNRAKHWQCPCLTLKVAGGNGMSRRPSPVRSPAGVRPSGRLGMSGTGRGDPVICRGRCWRRRDGSIREISGLTDF